MDCLIVLCYLFHFTESQSFNNLVIEQKSKSSPRSTKSSPRAKNVRSPRPIDEENNNSNNNEKVRVEEKIVEKVRVEKEIVEVRVEVEKIPESHLTKQKVMKNDHGFFFHT